jgi:hypothetical protein
MRLLAEKAIELKDEFIDMSWSDVFAGVFQENGVIHKAVSGGLGIVIGVATTFSTEMLDIFRAMNDDLVGHSIIPDMINLIIEVINNGLNRIIQIAYTWASRLIAIMSGINMYENGVQIVQLLQDGLESKIGELLSWWAGIKSQFIITPIVVMPSGSTYVPPDTGEIQEKAAKGLNMTVPQGYNKDDFLIGVSSGERVIVIPKMNIAKSVNNPNAYSSFTTMGGMSNSTVNNSNKSFQFNVNAANNIDEITRQYYILRLLEGE